MLVVLRFSLYAATPGQNPPTFLEQLWQGRDLTVLQTVLVEKRYVSSTRDVS